MWFSMTLFLDTETTGLYPGQICQLSYVISSHGNLCAKNFFFTVHHVEYGALAVHGFSVELLKKLSCGKIFFDYIDEIESDISAADVVVAHNYSFDSAFLREEFCVPAECIRRKRNSVQ